MGTTHETTGLNKVEVFPALYGLQRSSGFTGSLFSCSVVIHVEGEPLQRRYFNNQCLNIW